MTRRRRRAVTLAELLICLVFIGVGYVGVARLMSHSVRIAERASVRSEMAAVALSELERTRAMASASDSLHPLWVRTDAERNLRVTVTSAPASVEGLLAIEVTVRALPVEPPFEVTLTGWVARGEGAE
jgi:Tfp pilus assembly protein PilV